MAPVVSRAGGQSALSSMEERMEWSRWASEREGVRSPRTSQNTLYLRGLGLSRPGLHTPMPRFLWPALHNSR